MKRLGGILTAVACALAVSRVAAAPVNVDGKLMGDAPVYGSALSIQNTNTGFGNAMTGDSRIANGGSEIDQVFAGIADGRLYVLIAGNLESNYNKLEVFIDSELGGVNQLVGSNLPAFVDPYCCAGGPGNPNAALQAMNGLRFDADFTADHYLTFSNGNHTFGSPAITRWTLTAYYADLTDGTAGHKAEIGFQYQANGVEAGLGQGEPIDQLNNGCTGPADTNCMPREHEFAEPIDTVNDPANSRGHRDFLNDVGLLMAIDNSNTAGVNAGSGAATGNPASVTKGIEFSLPLATLGYTMGQPIKIAAFISSPPHSFVSNQFAGTGVVQANLGSNISAINLSTIAGNQFVTVPAQALAGDFNRDNKVDGLDYAVWRNGLPALYDEEDFGVWKEHYGDVAMAGTGQIAVPEPGAYSIVAMALVLSARLRRAKPQAIK